LGGDKKTREDHGGFRLWYMKAKKFLEIRKKFKSNVDKYKENLPEKRNKRTND
jgi:hypothetical protein